MNERHDIRSVEDIRLMVDTFYDQVREDSLLGPIFNARVKNWDEHLPRMYAFWSTLLLGSESYRGAPFDKHRGLGAEKAHFDRWLALFEKTVQSHFEGPTAQEAMKRARAIAGIFQFKLATLENR